MKMKKMDQGKLKREDEEILIGCLPKNQKEELHVLIGYFENEAFIDIRFYYPGKNPKASIKGTHMDISNLTAIIDLLKTAKKRARKIGLLPPRRGRR